MMTFLSAVVLLPLFSLGAQNQNKNLERQLRVLDARILSVGYDKKEDGTRVRLGFKVVDQNNRPVNNLRSGPQGNFRVFQDGVRETSFETITQSSVVAPTVGVTFVLDTSLSMEQEEALRPMKSAAKTLQRNLERSNRKFSFSYYQFATQVKKISSLDAIDDKEALSRFTSLYSAVKQAIQENPNNIIVLFSDGADNRSVDNRSFPVPHIEELEALIQSRQTQIHTVKLGIDDSNDFNGVNNNEVLRRISQFGSLRYAESVRILQRRFEEISDAIAFPYTFDYLSPRIAPGEYKIKIEIDSDGNANWDERWKAEASFELSYEIPEPVRRLEGQLQRLRDDSFCFVDVDGDNRFKLSVYNAVTKIHRDVQASELSPIAIDFLSLNYDSERQTLKGVLRLQSHSHENLDYVFSEDAFTRYEIRLLEDLGRGDVRSIPVEDLSFSPMSFFLSSPDGKTKFLHRNFTASVPDSDGDAIARFVTASGDFISEDDRILFFGLRQESIFKLED